VISAVMKNIFFIFFGYCLINFGCSTEKSSSSTEKSSNMKVKQGLSGYIKEIKGNQMPSPDIEPQEAKGVQTTLYIYEPTNISQVERIGNSAFYNAVRTKLFKSVDSDSLGYFITPLPAGTYSLFTKVDGKFYANSFDAQNNIAPAIVEENKLTKVNFVISAHATY
jgi:hypothetical protein